MVDKIGTKHEVIPSARRLVNSLRDIGYDFVRAVADIIDNSIVAMANVIDVQMVFAGSGSWIRISDNGLGMSSESITEAMRFGTEREYQQDELGKFGLGMKTASISQCRRLTVASRSNSGDAHIEIRQLDLDDIARTNKWEITAIQPDEYTDILTEPLRNGHGTVVLWESLDRMMRYKLPHGEAARKMFFKMARDLEYHLGMVFHRFLSGELGKEKTIRMSVNGNLIKPWDPFARSEGATVCFPPKILVVATASGVFNVRCAPYVLPSKEKFSTPEAFHYYSGISKWNNQQGFYIYRENRMIQAGGWNKMRTADEHTKLARIALDIHSDADDALGLNIMKTSIDLPENMRSALEPIVEEVVKWARKLYTPETRNTTYQTLEGSLAGFKQEEITNGSEFSNTESSKQHSLGKDDADRTVAPGGMVDGENKPASALQRAAEKVGELVALQRIRARLKLDDPDIAAQIGW